MKRFLLLLCSTLAIVLSACGGGGGSAGSNVQNQPTSTGSGAGTVTVADFTVGFVGKNTLNNSGGDEVILNIVALTASNNILPGATVDVAVDAGAIYTSASKVTDSEGRVTGKVTSPVNKANRTINVTVKIGAITKTVTIPVIGSEISVVSLPGAPKVSENVTYSITVKDSGGSGISGIPLNVSGSVGATGSVVTDINGNASVSAVAPVTAGTYTIVVSGSGVTTTKAVLVLGTAGGGITIPPALTLTNASLNANVASIRPNLSSSTTNRAVITFRMIDSLNQAVVNTRVKFSIVAPGLGAGEAMSTGNGIVYTDGTGTAQSDYISGQRSSPTNGVLIKACYARTDEELANDACPNQKTATLTVAGTALNLSIFSNNVAEGVGVGNLIYRKTFAIQVADSSGAPVPGAVVSAGVDITHYGKGRYEAVNTRGSVAPTLNEDASTGLNVVLDGNGFQRELTVPGVYTVTVSATGTATTGTIAAVDFRIWCKNEDLNRNGVLDGGEDVDRDGILDPRVSDIVVLPVGTNITDSAGNVSFQVQWGQSVGSWLAYTLKATTNVGGSEGTNSTSFITSVLEPDVPNGSFRRPPYGINGCNTNN